MAVIRLERRDWIHASTAAATLFFLYAITACPTIYLGDSPELSAVAAGFGVAHPPGYPLYTMITAVAVHLVPFLDPAHAANLMSGLYAALAVGLLLLLLRRLGLSLPAGWIAAFTLGLGNTFWSQAVAAEVYSFDAMLLTVTLHATMTLARSFPRPSTWFWWSLAAGLWLGHRMNNLIYLPALMILFWSLRDGDDGRKRLAVYPLHLAAGLVAAVLPFAYLPLASAFDPYMDMGDPETWDGFAAVVTATPFQRYLGGLPLEAILSRAGLLLSSLPLETGIGTVLACIGAWRLFRGGRGGKLTLLAFLLMITAGCAFMFLYRILDYEAYLIPACLAVAVLAAFGAQGLLDRRTGPFEGRRRLSIAVLLLCSTAILPFNIGRNDLRHHLHVHRNAAEMLDSVSERAVLFVQGDTSGWALGYLQAVEDRSTDVIVIRTGNISEWYMRQLAARFPDEAWPGFEEMTSTTDHAHRVIEHLSPSRTVFLTLSVNPDALVPKQSEFGWISRGLVREVRRKGEVVRLRDRALEDAKRLLAAVSDLPEPASHADLDLRSLYLEYGLALLQTAEQLARAGESEPARVCLETLLRMNPDRQEALLQDEVFRKNRERIPTLGLARQAERALAGLPPVSIE